MFQNMNDTTLKPLHWLPITPGLTPIFLLCLHLTLHSLLPGLWHSNPTCWQLAPWTHGTVTFLSWVDEASFWWWPLHQLLGLVYETQMRVFVFRALGVCSPGTGHFLSVATVLAHCLQCLLAGPCLTSSSPCREQEPGESGLILHPLWINTWLNELSH